MGLTGHRSISSERHSQYINIKGHQYQTDEKEIILFCFSGLVAWKRSSFFCRLYIYHRKKPGGCLSYWIYFPICRCVWPLNPFFVRQVCRLSFAFPLWLNISNFLQACFSTEDYTRIWNRRGTLVFEQKLMESVNWCPLNIFFKKISGYQRA